MCVRLVVCVGCVCVPFAETECICRYGVAVWVLQEEIAEKEGCVASGGEGVGWSKRNVPLRLSGEKVLHVLHS